MPIGDLLGPVAAAAADGRPGTAGQARWRLGLLGGDPLPPERSLTTCGVGDGAILTLTLDPPPATAQPPLTIAQTPRFADPGAADPPASRRGAGGGRSLVGRWGRGPRSRDQGDELLEAAIAAPRLGRCAVVGVVSAAAGTGRATVAALLASVLAATRQGLTVAVDVHPGPGSLTDRLAPDLDVPAGDLLGLLDHPALTTGELMACLTGRASRGAGSRNAGGSGLRSASPALVAGVGGSRAPDRRAWTLLVQGLARHADALVLDCGAGLGGPGARTAVAAADQLVLVTEPEPSPESRRVAGALADLGHAVVVAAGPSSAGGLGSAGASGFGSRSTSGFGSRSASPAVLARLLPGVRGVVPLPHLPAAVPPRDWAEVPPSWRHPAHQLAYLLAADWPALGMTVAGGGSRGGSWPPG